jgi:uncharacterized repeat protein (TIGR01451 family)
VTFTFTISNPAPSTTTFTNIGASFSLFGVPLNNPNPSPTPNASLPPGGTIPYTFTYTVTGNEPTCNIAPIANVKYTGQSGAGGTDVPYNQAAVVPQVLKVPTVSAVYLSPPGGPSAIPSVTVGQSVTINTSVTNNGCLSANFVASPNKPGDVIQWTGFPVGTNSVTIAPNTTTSFTTTHIVTAADGAQFSLSAVINATATSGTATPIAPVTVSSTGLLFNVLGAATTGTPGSGTLTITKTASIQSATSGQSFAFTITVTNSSASTFSNIIVTDTVPAETMTVTAVSGSAGVAATNAGNQVTAAIASLAPGATATITVNVTVNSGVRAPTTLTNTATLNSTGGTPLTATVTIPVATGASVLPTTGYPRETQLMLLVMGGAFVVAVVSFGYLMRGRRTRRSS